MKEASIKLRLDKNHEVFKHRVTPVECVLLASMFHKAVGDVPVIVDESTIKETHHVTFVDEKVSVDGIEERDLVKDGKVVLGPDGKPQKEKYVATREVVRKVQKEIPDKRTIDDELDRLRSVYAPQKIKAMLSEVRELPTEDFNKAIERGMKLALPSDALSSAASVTKGI